MRVWDDILTDTDNKVIEKAGYGQSRGLGKQPVLMIIDPQYNYCGENLPILDQIERWPSGAGETAWIAIENIKRILKYYRTYNMPVIYTRHVQKDLKFDGFATKTDRNQKNYLDGSKGTTIVSALKPHGSDLIVDKSYSSAFYGTPLLSYLIKLKIDTLLVTGGTTSGCVRTLCVDAISRNYNVAVLEDAVFDRISVSHKTGLLDLWMKYCDVISTDEAVDYIKSLN